MGKDGFMGTFMKKAAALLLVLVLGIFSPIQGNVNVRADETAASTATQVGKDFLQKVIGEYQPLFEGASFEAKYEGQHSGSGNPAVGALFRYLCGS